MATLTRIVQLLSIGMLMLIGSVRVGANEIAGYGGTGDPPVSVMISIAPTTVDASGSPRPALGRWLAHIAEKSQIRLSLRPLTNDQRLEEVMRRPDGCSLGYARLPAREKEVHWLMEVKRDRMVFVGRQDDPFGGNLSDFLRLANGKLGAPSGIYRTVLENRSIQHIAVDDQRQLAHMVADGDLRFGLLIGGSMNTPEIRTLPLRIVAELPELGFWFACSRAMPKPVVTRIAETLKTRASQQLHREALSNLLPGIAASL